jgi:glycosyltransferase involved in cell wall biosynthesis
MGGSRDNEGDRMKIAVLDVAADYGGAYTILKQHVEEAAQDKANRYVFILSVGKFQNTANSDFLYFPWVKKSWFHRLYFDRFVIQRVIRNLDVDAILSLQNITVAGVSIPQTLYLHQPLPFEKIRFSLFENPKFWVYQNIIARMIFKSVKQAKVVIVQSKWMRDACVRITHESEDKFKIIPPTIPNIQCAYQPGTQPLFFYPASAYSYKNHKTIIEAVELLKKRGMENYRVVLTLKGNEAKYLLALRQRSDQADLPIDWIGSIPLEEVYRYYAKSILLFPSSIETFGLPLLEARNAKCPIIASDRVFSREILEGYTAASFFDPRDASKLADLMSDFISPKRV